jgi:EAL and modified HD-GYP domain-containing signal transduction protein
MTRARRSFVARQAIVDRDLRRVAYELLFRTPHGLAPSPDDEDAASLAAVTDALVDARRRWRLGRALAFVNVGTATLLGDLPAALPRERVVIELLEHVVATPEVIARVQALRGEGFRFALDDYDHGEGTRALLPHVAYVKLDVLALPAARVAAIVDEVRRQGLALLAEKIETRAQFEACLAQRFDLFQGYYFSRPEAMRG